LQSIRNSRITRYPDSDSTLLKERIARYNNVDKNSVLVVNGTSQGMFLIVSSLLSATDSVAIVEPTYSEYRDACRLKTDKITSIRMTAEESFALSVPRILKVIEKETPRLLWLCSPNNPTGSYLREDDFETIRQACVAAGCLFILDEAYICFVPDERRYAPLRDGVIVLRSMTKDFSIPGLRLGYILASPDIIAGIRRWQPEWSISAPAQDAGLAGFKVIDAFRESWKKTADRRNRLRRDLQSLGIIVHDSCANFFLAEVDDLEAIKQHLWKDLILVRDCGSFGLKNTMRIGIRTDGDNQKLVDNLKDYYKA